ncbi:MAG: hypothetical protein IRY91_09045 [Gemmatimonadaceae bacterium]|nr:hypothetical protein [Gemmatimonadaceae bacterium]
MKVSVITLAALAAVSTAAPAARAQQVDAQCSDISKVGAGLAGGDACQKAVDLYRYMNIQLGTLIAGGNATLGQGGTLGGLGHFAVDVRANVMRANVPDVAAAGVVVGPAEQSAYTTSEKWAAVPTADVAIGIFKGIPLGITSVGGIDALVNVSYLPEFTSNDVKVSVPDGSLKFGFGARVGLLKETALVPGVSVSYLRRDLPITNIDASISSTRSVSVHDLDLYTTAWRLTASKSFLFLGLAAGIGQDKYEADADVTYDVDGNQPSQPLHFETAPKRTNMFVSASLNLMLLKIVGEVGRVTGGELPTYNTFDKKATDARYYGSVGIRIGH